MTVFKFLFQGNNIVLRTTAQFAVFLTAGTIGISVAATSASATLDATASNDTPQAITAGILSLTETNTVGSIGFAKSLSNMVPGDTLSFNINVINGSVAGQDLRLAINDGLTGTPLTRIPSKSLTVSILQCVGGTWSGNVCSTNSTSSFLATTPLTTMNPSATPAGGSVSLISGTVPANTTYSLRFTVTLPSGITESTLNGVPQGSNIIQGQTANITWLFTETQRPGALTEG